MAPVCRGSIAARLVAAGAALLALGGCTLTEAPEVRVADASITDRSDEGLVVTFVLEAENPNEEQIPLREVTSRLRLEDGRTIRTRRLAEATVRRYGVQEFRLPVAIPLNAAEPDPETLRYTLRGRVRWPPPGAFNELLFDIELYRPSAPFRDRGRIDVASTQRNAPAEPESDAAAHAGAAPAPGAAPP